MTLGSLFDGIGGFPLAAARNGITPIWASEIEAAPVSVTKRHFPEMKHLGDITKINGAEIDPVDIVTFGSPCQDLSLAGKRQGLSGERSGLFTEAVRIIKEMRSATNGKHPSTAVWENVPGAFSANRGRDFQTVIEEIARIAEPGISIPRPPKKTGWLAAGAVMGDGWSIAWRVLDAQYWGVPQRRKRIFLVADFRDGRAAEILFKPGGLPRDSAGGRKKGEAFTSGAGESTEPAGLNGRSAAGTLPIMANDYKEPNCVFAAAGFRGIAYNDELAGTLGTDADHVYCLQGSMAGRKDKNGPQGSGINEGLSFALNATDRHAVAVGCRSGRVQGISGALQAGTHGYSLNCINPVATFAMQGFGNYKESDGASSIKGRDHKDSTDLISEGCTVRRLTPVECERLQGFPDGWTENGHDNKKLSDSARYKALGNSVAVPCVDFIMGRIKEGLAL